jgi:transposase-like protein
LPAQLFCFVLFEIGSYNAWKPGVKEQIEMQTLNSGGVRDISRALVVSRNTVISERKKILLK